MNLQFKFSYPYESTLNGTMLIQDAKPHIEFMENFWENTGPAIEHTFFKTIGLSLPETCVCYLNSIASLSDPLSIKIEDQTDMIDSLVHELIHVLFMHEYQKIASGWKKLEEQFKSESRLCFVHILVHAVHEIIAKKLFPERIDRLKTYTKNPAYVRSWEIVDEIGAETIIDILRE